VKNPFENESVPEGIEQLEESQPCSAVVDDILKLLGDADLNIYAAVGTLEVCKQLFVMNNCLQSPPEEEESEDWQA